MIRLILLRGLPGSGKTTWAAQLAAEPGVTVLSSGSVRAALPVGTAPGFVQASLAALVRGVLSSDQIAVVDDRHCDPAELRVWAGVAERAGAKLEIWHLRADPDECRARCPEVPAVLFDALQEQMGRTVTNVPARWVYPAATDTAAQLLALSL